MFPKLASVSSVVRCSLRVVAPAQALRAFTSSASALESPKTANKQERPRRTLFYIPGSEERKLNSSLKLKADCLVYDLEDGVAVNRKGAARQQVFNAFQTFDVGRAEKAVRINAVGSGLEIDDLNVVLRSKNLQALVIPKVQSARDVEFISRMIDSVAPESNRASIRLLPCVESALGVINVKEIATADPRIDGIIFASEDYCADTGLLRTPSRKEMLYARQAVVTAACAFGLQSIDIVCQDYKSENILTEECQEGREFGFTGKQAIHPAQVETIHKIFSPTEKEIERATKIMEGYNEHLQKGIGAFVLDGKMIDMPVVKWAQRLLARAQV
ncbi:Pyruvate/Phosphoenolpyruvate kinase-like domain-containing protein [Polychytrium aggregatum]|uniref:Pyruvate/Phosphoenolpyruvate kinase-like domain-containing protein n=1 Tax=Polychytrium aggregatum TaxID=110093 RepID=UPI0022FE3727|nr:Pyruvate/Phosphoenolpyruvate kinase-like domain-containing protein [Polychytrium aggregatum]KAI9209244.1 Pyruvate/Phosphoenolpyruvate kinase-like domain-containing protein [Polychytrium aggregatum]